jgi:Glycosyltransferase Family 4
VRIHGVVDNDIHPPRFGSTQRSFGLFRGMARRHEVDVLCVVPYRNRALREDRAAGVRIHRRRAWYTAAAWRLERMRLAPLAWAARGHASRADRWLGELPGTPDALCVGPWFGGLLERSRAPLKVYLSQNVEADHFAATAPPVLGRAAWARRVRDLEARLAATADRVVVCSEEDAERMASLHGVVADRLRVAPNGYDETALRAPDAAQRAAARAALDIGDDVHVGVFLGSDTKPNRAALDWLLEHAMPRLSRDGFCLLVLGEIAASVRGRRESWLRAVPPVDDLLPILHAADAGLNPVTLGGGSNVKVPTCLAAGLAMVTTPFGLRGYRALESLARVTALESFTDTWALRPRGWARDGASPPAALPAFAWGAIGERLGNDLAQTAGLEHHDVHRVPHAEHAPHRANGLLRVAARAMEPPRAAIAGLIRGEGRS